MQTYKTGTGQIVGVHEEYDCVGKFCVIHNPSNHHMIAWPTNWRFDRGLMERICSHGIGHPDPDHIDHLPAGKRNVESIHGCDGCCSGKKLL